MHQPRRAVLAAALLAAVALAGCSSAERDVAAADTAPVHAVEDGDPAADADSDDDSTDDGRADGGPCEHPGAHDIDGDGHADAVVGERLGDHGRTSGFHVFYGTAAGLTATGEDGGRDDAVFSRSTPGVPGEPADDAWGKALAVADFDGDGCADVAVGAPEASFRGSGKQNSWAGEVTILYGTPSGLSTRGAQTVRQDGGQAKPGLVLVPGVRENDDQFGAALAAADFDGDGLADLAIASPGEGRGENRSNDYHGCIDYCPERTPAELAADAEANAKEAADPRPYSVGQGAVSIVYGSPAGLGRGERGSRTFSQDDAFIGGEAENQDHFGHALAAGDFDGDGVADLAVSVPNERRAGATSGEDKDIEAVVHVLPGGARVGLGERKAWTVNQLDPAIPGAARSGAFGHALAAGDLNGDGADDLAVGAPYTDKSGGAVVVLYSSGPDGLTARAAQTWTQVSAGVSRGDDGVDHFGGALAIGRFGGPGSAADLAVGAENDGGTGEQEGSVTVLFGTADGLTAGDARLLAWPTRKGGTGDRVGTALSALPIRDPGRDDLIIGAPGAGENATPTDSAGALVEVPSGADGPRAADARRWRSDTAGVAGDPVRGGALGHSLG